MKIKKIFKKQIARELRLKGFEIVGTEPNLYKPEFNVYLFEYTEDLSNALGEISAALHRERSSK